VTTIEKYSNEELAGFLRDNADLVRRTIAGETGLLAGDMSDGSSWVDIYEQAADALLKAAA
jgi:hypothetical protein